MNLSELHFRVCDKGLFLPIARRLAREVGKVTYWTPHEKAFPLVRDFIGDGFPDVERVDCYLEDIDTVDCFVFPDIGFGGLQLELEAQGKPVWGARQGDELEIYRGRFLAALKTTGLPVPKYEKVDGITKLRSHLREKKDRWIKISRFRGDCETFHWRSWAEDENELDWYAARFGPFRDIISFYVFDPIEAKVEDGIDSWCIDGQFPRLILHGMEAKDKAYLGAFQRYEDTPEELRIVNDKFGPVLRDYGYRSFFSSEVRITSGGESFFIDPTCRAGSPPSQVMTEMIGNYAEVIWRGAQGECIDPEPAGKFGVQALVKLKGKSSQWGTLKVDDELDRWLKCGTCLRMDNQLLFPPDPEGEGKDIGWLTGIGDQMEEAIKHLQHNIKLLPDGACCDISPIGELLAEVREAEDQGVEMTQEEVPEPETVVSS